jgi:hypothetical protein
MFGNFKKSYLSFRMLAWYMQKSFKSKILFNLITKNIGFKKIRMWGMPFTF